jgi:hypothetical protein
MLQPYLLRRLVPTIAVAFAGIQTPDLRYLEWWSNRSATVAVYSEVGWANEAAGDSWCMFVKFVQAI